MKLSIFGLGYVGAVSLACLARDGHDLIGVDIDASKLDLIRQGRTPIIETGMAELMQAAVRSGRVEVTGDATRAVHGAEMSFVCVGTPAQPNGSQNLRALEHVCQEIGVALGTKAGHHVVVVRSTVLPGTVQGLVTPTLEAHSGKRAGRDFDVCFQPEFLREGSSIRDYDHPPLTVVGTDSARASEALRGVFGHLPCEFRVCPVATAEMLKYACNAFHAVKITFANEMGRICQALDVDSHEVMDLVCRDRQLNISPAYLRPGFAYGGSCLPKDLAALRHLAGRRDVAVPMLGTLAYSNTVHIEHALETILGTGRRSIGMLGLSHKAGTDDLRESPLVLMAERLIGKGLAVAIHDPDVNVARLVGTNRRYIESTIPHLAALMSDDPQQVIDRSDLVVVGLRTPPVLAALRERCRPDHVLVDLVGLPDREALKGTYRGVCW